MSYLESFDSREIWYESFDGKSPVLVFIHGYAMNSTVWQNQIDFFRNNQRIILDLRGHGKSSEEPAQNLETFSKDIKKILEKENIKKATLVGHSLGATIALDFQKKFPDKVDKLILIAPYIKKSQLTLRSRFFLFMLNFLPYSPNLHLDHSKGSFFQEFRCVFSSRLKTVKLEKEAHLIDYNFNLPSNTLVINSFKDEIIKPYFKEGVFLNAKHLPQIYKAEKVSELIQKFLV